MTRIRFTRLALMSLFLLTTVFAFAQTQIAGYVRDSVSREPIPFASVSLLETGYGTQSNDKGGFVISTSIGAPIARVSAVGYKTKDIPLRIGQAVLVVDLVPTSVELGEVVVKRTKEKYSKKDNPAVALARRLIDQRSRYNPLDSQQYQYDKFERLLYGFNDVGDSAKRKNTIVRKLVALAEFSDTSAISGKQILPISVDERYCREYYRHSPKNHREHVLAIQNAGLDQSFDDPTSIRRFMDDMFREVDIFGNDITLLANRFVSPLSHIGISYYKYYLTDTVTIDDRPYVELSFSPFTPESFGFIGRMYVATDSSLFIRRVTMNVPHKININYVQRLYIRQDFIQAPDGTRLKTRDDMEAELQIAPRTPELFARRERSYSNHQFQFDTQAEPLFRQPAEQVVADEASRMPQQFWDDHRLPTSRTDASQVRSMLRRLRKNKFFYWTEQVVVALVKGYVPTSKPSRFDIGPLNTIISGNSLEGVRLRLGGMSTVNLSRHLFARTYAAYGTRDKKWKYMAQLEYSFRPKKHLDQEFPIHSIRLKHQYDIDKLGQHYLYTNPDNVFLMLKRQKDNKLAYLRTTELEWKLETESHFSISLKAEHNVHEASRFIQFMTPDSVSRHSYQQAGFTATLRYAPGEKFYQSRSYRIPINMDAPIVTLSHTYMPRGFLGSLYEVNKTEIGLQKRFWFSAFGYMDVILKGAKIWSKVAYPDLLLPNANLSYTIQPESYALMDAMEFANDQYLSWDVTYWANGALLNRIPLIKYLKLREVFSFRGLWGSLSAKNDPSKSSDVFLFPAGTRCKPMDKQPYMEIGVGLDNILTFLRVDYVWRLTYRNTPGIDRSGVRIQLHFTF